MTTVYFIRHAQADNSVRDGRVRPLTEKGMADRALVTAFLQHKGIDAVLSSPFKRAVDTIAPFAEENNLAIERIEDFREQKSSSDRTRHGKGGSEFLAYLEQQWADFSFKLTDGESLADVQARNIAALGEVLKKHKNKTIAIGTHGMALSTIINYYGRSYNFKDFLAILTLSPWVVRMEFDGGNCVSIEKIDLLKKNGRHMNIVFMGTPAFAVPCLERLLADGFDIPAVFCQPDKPQGRKMLLAPPPVKQAALAHGLPVLQPEKLRGNQDIFDLLRNLAPDLIVVVAYGKILPRELLDIPKHGCINVHASLLPKYRGAAPIQWAVLNGETETGVTTQQMDAGIDTGGMLLQAKTPIPEDMTAGELYDILSELGAEVLSDTLKLLARGKLVAQKQEDAQATHAPMLSKALSPLDFTRPAQALHNQVRGLNPWPGAAMEFEGRPLKVHKTRVAGEGGLPLRIPCGDGNYLELLTVQAEGKRAMPAEEFLRGLRRT